MAHRISSQRPTSNTNDNPGLEYADAAVHWQVVEFDLAADAVLRTLVQLPEDPGLFGQTEFKVVRLLGRLIHIVEHLKVRYPNHPLLDLVELDGVEVPEVPELGRKFDPLT